MNYEETIEYLADCARLGSRPGLESVRELLRRLGNPQHTLFFVHIAGTNGKGSTASFIANGLKEAGYRTGFFASPFVYDVTETLCINSEPISREAVAETVSLVREAADAMPGAGYMHPTEFEILTAAAFVYFKEKKCDIAVVECGMGGRLDATNVMDKKLAVLTRIDIDHTAFLGNSLTEIAKEKCGILRKHVPLVVYPGQAGEAMEEIKKQADAYECALHIPAENSALLLEENLQGSRFSYKQHRNLHITLCGRHQMYNAITAIEALEALQEFGFTMTEESLAIGLEQTKWNGRFEVLSQEPPVILDGAHNKNGAEAFCETMQKTMPNRDSIGVVGMLADKDYRYCLSMFGRVCSQLIVTEVPNIRSARMEELLSTAKELGLRAEGCRHPKEAVEKAFLMRKGEQGIFCVGSLYALAEFKSACLEALSGKRTEAD
ncbi:MAG: bifunctional folylpolyglutamate synthase/dihydrofolate synthase [Ruminococcaceae bacterium]|nr:bifunctional folylpolyglutamate synthase/dihydrofolate synthase [Oscillospiraceae bacterium]